MVAIERPGAGRSKTSSRLSLTVSIRSLNSGNVKVEFDLGVWDRPAIPAILPAKLLPAVIGRIRLWAA